jgi:hypothetical protein
METQSHASTSGANNSTPLIEWMNISFDHWHGTSGSEMTFAVNSTLNRPVLPSLVLYVSYEATMIPYGVKLLDRDEFCTEFDKLWATFWQHSNRFPTRGMALGTLCPTPQVGEYD